MGRSNDREVIRVKLHEDIVSNKAENRSRDWAGNYLSALMQGSAFKDNYRQEKMAPLSAIFLNDTERIVGSDRTMGDFDDVEYVDPDELPYIVSDIRSDSFTLGITRGEVANRITSDVVNPTFERRSRKWHGVRKVVFRWVKQVSEKYPTGK